MVQTWFKQIVLNKSPIMEVHVHHTKHGSPRETLSLPSSDDARRTLTSRLGRSHEATLTPSDGILSVVQMSFTTALLAVAVRARTPAGRNSYIITKQELHEVRMAVVFVGGGGGGEGGGQVSIGKEERYNIRSAELCQS